MSKSSDDYFEFLAKEVHYYRWHANKAMILFIVLRLVLTVLSASLPALAALAASNTPREYLTLASIMIAVLAALDTQFKWGDEWRQYRTTQMSVERLTRLYHQGAYAPDLEEEARFHKFVNDAETLIARDSQSFFKFRITAWREAPADDK